MGCGLVRRWRGSRAGVGLLSRLPGLASILRGGEDADCLDGLVDHLKRLGVLLLRESGFGDFGE